VFLSFVSSEFSSDSVISPVSTPQEVSSIEQNRKMWAAIVSSLPLRGELPAIFSDLPCFGCRLTSVAVQIRALQKIFMSRVHGS
jgi:hypothetical protein